MQRPPIAAVALGVVAALASLLPIGYLLLRLAEGFEAALAELLRTRTLELLWNSISLTLSVSLTALAIGILQAWLTVRTNLVLAPVFAVLATLPLAIPSFVLALGYLSIFPWFSGFWAAWLTLSLATAPYVFLAVSAALISSNFAAEEVARSLGKNRLQVFWSVSWPQIRPAALASGLLVALYTLSEFGAIALLRFDTFTRAIYNAYRGSFDRTSAAALALVLVALTLVVIFFERRYRGDRWSAPSTSGRRRLIDLGGLRLPSLMALSVLGLAGAGLPIVSLIGWSLNQRAFDLLRLGELVVSSLLVALAAGVIIGIFALAISVWNLRFQSRLSGVVDLTAWTAHALPAVVVALALVFFGANLLPGIYQTIWLLLLAYLILFLPNALGLVGTPIALVPRSIEEVARSQGLSKNAALGKVVLPIAAPGIIAGIALASLTVLKELPATLLLRPNQLDTLATELWQATEVLAYSQAAPYALALIIIAGVPALFLNAQARRLISEVS
ncbi:MAG: iron ABC transporter permease [Candidatus Aquiluna sp. XM-24bin5]|nr:MAG: iron ABC transporter permease [Candidatus Aquiluna sp. XM-24bin5]